MEIFPAIDLKDGNVVRLLQGDFNKIDTYSTNPQEIYKNFISQNAKNLHIVDLDGAKEGTIQNYKTIESIVSNGELFVQVGGGIRNEERIKTYLDLGVNRLILGTAAIQDPNFLNRMVQKYNDKIAVSVDARNNNVAINGWLQTTDINSFEFCEKLKDIGVSTIIYTDISKDGAMQGPNFMAYKKLVKIDNLNIIASGGISNLQDLQELRQIGTYGAIIGKALYNGNINLSTCLEV